MAIYDMGPAGRVYGMDQVFSDSLRDALVKVDDYLPESIASSQIAPSRAPTKELISNGKATARLHVDHD